MPSYFVVVAAMLAERRQRMWAPTRVPTGGPTRVQTQGATALSPRRWARFCIGGMWVVYALGVELAEKPRVDARDLTRARTHTGARTHVSER